MPRGNESSHHTRGAFACGEWLVEPELNRIGRREDCVHVEPKIMDVLLRLAVYAPEVVTRRQLVDEVWDGGYISDNTLTHAVAELRRAFGDDPAHPTYIETIHRRGYRLLEPVSYLGDPSSSRASGHSRFSVRVADRIVPLREGSNLIGRLPDALLSVTDLQISRRHARITVHGPRAFLDDLGSRNGTRLNGQIVVGREQLQHGDLIVLGDGAVVMRVVGARGLEVISTEEDTPTRPAYET